MKSLIFSGLVLGSSAYLLATQTDLLPDWKAKESLAAKAQQTERQPLPETLQEQVKSIRESELVSELKANIITLQAELGQIKQALQDAKATKAEAPLLTDLPVAEPKLPTDEALPRLEIVPDSVPVSPYMPVKERSDALMELAHRMEMKAAAN